MDRRMDRCYKALYVPAALSCTVDNIVIITVMLAQMPPNLTPQKTTFHHVRSLMFSLDSYYVLYIVTLDSTF